MVQNNDNNNNVNNMKTNNNKTNKNNIRIVPIDLKYMRSIHNILIESFGTKRCLAVVPTTGSYNDLYKKYETMSDMKKQLGAIAIMVNPNNNQNEKKDTKSNNTDDPDHTSNNNDIVVGYVQMSMKGLPLFLEGFHKCDTNEMYIEMIAVSGESRGCGIGQKLLNWCKDQSIRYNKNMIRLEVLNGNRAIGLYKRYGFNICKKETDCISSCIVCIFFGRPYGCCNNKWGSLVMEMNITGMTISTSTTEEQKDNSQSSLLEILEDNIDEDNEEVNDDDDDDDEDGQGIVEAIMER